MCGVAGMVLRKELPEERIEQFISATDLMRHRGPDHKGVYRQGNVILVHHRLSIIDLSPEANQPFTSASGQCVASYNGEIYNFLDLARSLDAPMRTRSDTEVMLEHFERFGFSGIRNWNGIFAAGVHDRRNRRVHLIRDRFGVKPLCYFETDEAFLFASEAKVILDWLPQFRISPRALSQYMLYGHATGTEGFVEGLKRVAPGQCLSIDEESAGIVEKCRYWAVEETRPIDCSTRIAVEQTRALLEAAVRRQLVSDVPVGLFLSGGIDSSTIAALASRSSSSPLDAYSIEYDVNIGGKSEMDRARLVAGEFGLHHHEVELSAGKVADIFSDVVFQYDEPFADPAGVALYQLSRACGQRQRVVLQGDGGDELFAGYRRYGVLQHQVLFRIASACHRFLPQTRYRQRLERLHAVLSTSNRSRLIAKYLTEETEHSRPARMLGEEMQQSIAEFSGQEDYIEFGNRVSRLDPVQQLLYTDTAILLPWKYLEKVDKATMAFSIESRVPFLDNELADFVLALPSSVKSSHGRKKYVLRKAMEGLVPDTILSGRKRGFDVPVRAWMERGLHDYAAEVFSASDPQYIDRKEAGSALSAYRSGELESVPLLWKTLVLAEWFSCYRDKIYH